MPKLQIPKKLKTLITTKKRFVVLLGGRGSAKSETVGRILTMRSQTEAADVLCGREFQNSIEDSVHKLLKNLIEDELKIPGFKITDNKIDAVTGGSFRFRGFARNSEAVKSAQGFKYSWIEEAQSLSKESIRDLTPTIRAKGSQLFFTANPKSSEDPFSKRFINPYISELKANGFYEDDLHLIIMINYVDNPWFPSELEQERQWDYEHLTRAEYDHIWLGEFNDSVENSLILAEYFDACVDAHKTLGFEPVGLKMASHDPSDEGNDNKGYAFRHGSILLDLKEKATGNVNDGGDWAVDLALNHGVDAFTWDCDGLGVGLNRQVSKSFDGKHTLISQFKGSETVDNPDAIFEHVEGKQIQDQKTNKQALANKRAQYYYELRKRMVKTYEAVVLGVYHNPDDMLSFDSSIELLPKLRSELCRLPVKPSGNGTFELYRKDVMKNKFKIESPNLGDCVMMLMRQPHKPITNFRKPQPIKPMGRR